MEEKLKEFEEKFSYAFIGDFANAEIQEIKDWIAENFTLKASQLEPPVRMQTAEETKKCLKALGSAWRGDWSGFDGRTLRGQLEDITSVLDGKLTYEQFCERADIHPKQLCWNEYADED